MSTEIGLVLKYVSRSTKNINVVNYLIKNPPPVEECYYAKETYVVNDLMEGSDPMTKAPIGIINSKV